MLSQIQWPDNRPREYVSPFQRGSQERNLRLTLHSESLHDLGEEEGRALLFLTGLATLPGMDVAETSRGDHPQLVLDLESENRDAHEAAVWHGNETLRHGSFRVDAKSQFPNWVADAESLDRPGWGRLQSVRDEILLGIAHMAVRHDIFVTTSPLLLALRADRDFLRRHQHMVGINPRLPSESVKIAALFQRSRDEYRPRDFFEDETPRITPGRGTFYRVLAYEHISEAYRYESACGRAGRGDGTYALAKSVLERYRRALEARDALGFLFYTPNADSIADRAAYHFDYLNLLLFGAFDALARLAHRVYWLRKSGERRAGFHHAEFRAALATAGAADLERLTSSQYAQDVFFILKELRNTIHAIVVEARNTPTIESLNTAQMAIPDGQGEEFWEVFTRIGSPNYWGIAQHRNTSSAQRSPYTIWVEPYTYAIKMVEACRMLINEIMLITDVTRLLPSGFDLAQLRTGPQDWWGFPLRLRGEIKAIG